MANLGRSSERVQEPIQQHQVSNSWSWIKDNHTFKFGGEIRKGINVDVNRPIISGQYNFSSTGSRQIGAGGGSAFASYMLGWVNAFSLRETELLDRYNYYLAWYAQDDWKVTPDLTLNIGFRWETDTPVTDKNNRSNSFDMNQTNPVSGTPGVVKFAGLDGWPESPFYADWNNFGPRFGFAYNLGGQNLWVIRGGYGVFYEGPDTSANAATLGFGLSAAASSPDGGVTPALVFQNGPDVSLEKPPLNDSFGAVPVGAKAKQNVDFYDLNRRTGYAHHLNLGLQRMLPNNMLLEVSYAGNLSRKLPTSNLNLNQVLPEDMGPGNAQSRRPYPQFLNVRMLSPTMGNNNYHSGSIRLEKRFARGLVFLAGYTFARAIGDADNQTGDLGDNQVYQDLYNRRLDRGPDALDINHRFAWSSTYHLPGFTEGALGTILGGWVLGSIANIQSGGPYTVTMNSNSANAFSAGGQRANLVGDPVLPSSQRTVQRWFNLDAFEEPAQYTFGNAGRGILRGDGRINFDFSIAKNFNIRETLTVQFRSELFNAFNHADFSLPNRSMGSANFGTISGATSPRTIQFGLRITF
jgi:hypothetical protein